MENNNVGKSRSYPIFIVFDYNNYSFKKMSTVHSISIHNFRGIRQLEHTFDSNNLVVLIGRCDSGKSTILKAISLVLCPYWNPSISASDFYNEDISVPIEIEVTLRDVLIIAG